MMRRMAQHFGDRISDRISREPGRPRWRAIVCITALSLLPTVTAQADEMALGLRYGEDGSEYRGTGLSLRFGPWWSRDKGNWTASLNPEIEFTHFRFRGDAAGPRSLNEVGGVAMFRFTRQSGGIRPYAEAGLGAALFNHQQLGEKVFSTAFQFSEHVGLGLGFAEHWSVGYRFSHYSNADIRLPNQGLDVQQLMVNFSF